jgi:hypothetical protein
MDDTERTWLLAWRRYLINTMRAEQDFVKAIEARLDLKSLDGRSAAKEPARTR